MSTTRRPRSPNSIGRANKVGRREVLALLATAPVCVASGDALVTDRVKPGDLIRAVYNGDVTLVRKLVSGGADVNENIGTADRPLTPAFVAMVTGQPEIATLLAVSAIDLDNSINYRGWVASDFAGYFRQHELVELLAGTSDDGREAELSKYDVDRTAYVANGIAQLGAQRDLATAVGLTYITCTIRTHGDQCDREEVLAQAARLRDTCLQRTARVAASDVLSTSALVAMQTISDRSVALQVADSINNCRAPIAPGCSAGAEFMHSISEQRFLQSVLEQAYVTAKGDSGRAAIVDGFVAARVNARIDDGARMIVKNNVDQLHPTVAKLVVYDPSVTSRPQQGLVYRSWQEVFADIKETNHNAKALLDKIESAEANAQRAKELNDKFAVLRGSAYLVSAIAGSRDPELGRQIAGVANGAIQIGQSITTFVAATAVTAASCATLVGGIVVGIMAIISAFSGPSTEEIILKQLQELRQQVEQVRQQMHARFDALDRRLDQLFIALEVAFNALNMEVSLARQEIAAIARRLTMVELSLINLETNVRDYIGVASDRELWRKVDPILEWRKHNKYRPLPSLLFVDGLNALRQGAKEATDALSINGSLPTEEIFNDDLLAKRVLGGLVNGRLDSNLAILKSACSRFDPSSVIVKTPLTNPLRWAMMSDLYAQLAGQFPQFFRKYVTSEGINELLRYGEQWRAVTKDLTAERTSADGTTTHAQLFLNLVQHFRSKAEQLRTLVQQRILKYQVEKVEGYDLWGGSAQAPRWTSKRPSFFQREVGPGAAMEANKHAQGYIGAACWPSSKLLAAPPEIMDTKSASAILAPEALIAHHLGLGVLTAEWNTPQWVMQRLVVKKPGDDWTYGRASLVVSVNFRSLATEDAKPISLCSRSVNTGREAMHQIVTPNWAFGNGWSNKEFHTEITACWEDMRKKVLAGVKPSDNVPATVAVAAKLVEDHFAAHRKQLERELIAELKGADGVLTAALRELTAAKAMLDAFVSLGLPTTLAEDEQFRSLFVSNSVTKGETRLLDEGAMEYIIHDNVSLLDVMRDPEWINGPLAKAEAFFSNLKPSKQTHPLVESTMQRLTSLKAIHHAGQPPVSLHEAARSLKKDVQTYFHSLDKKA